MKIGVRVLGSSSAGNCTLIWDNKKAILIDCGFEPDYILKNLDLLNLNINSISGVFITHTHGDHVNKAMLKLLNRQHIPVYCHNNIRGNLIYRYASSKRVFNHALFIPLTNDEIIDGNFSIRCFEIPHDSKGGCFGYNIFKTTEKGEKKITVATDIGFPEERLIDYFVDSDLIVIESNHDIDMLENSGRPLFLINRIKEIGHLSNAECSGMLQKILEKSKKLPEAIVLVHISQQCNTNLIAENNMKEFLNSKEYGDIKVIMSYCSRPNDVFFLE
jgi:phosphoribosyl 1,2-cyclic phosphodiesterase